MWGLNMNDQDKQYKHKALSAFCDKAGEYGLYKDKTKWLDECATILEFMHNIGMIDGVEHSELLEVLSYAYLNNN